MGDEGDHTRLDLEVIKGMGTGLSNIKKAFEGLDKLSGKYGDDFGDGDLADKFEDFAKNWEHKRKELTAEVDSLAQIAKAAGKAYEDIDHQLAEAIRGAQDPVGPKAPKAPKASPQAEGGT
ncbi:hypothetical protein ACQB60_26235 [Actinomycetota bacterium Odt1-20B]